MTPQKDNLDSGRRLSRRDFLGDAACLAAAPLMVPGCVVPARRSPVVSEKSRTSDPLDTALEALCDMGPGFAGRPTNHGPMVAETLVTLGHPAEVAPWIEEYKDRLRPPPDPTGRDVTNANWRQALGEPERVNEWIAFFDRELEKIPWRTALAEWTPRLAPGLFAALFHGVIRTAHAARSLEIRENTLRRHELAQGLGMWAAHYTSFPSAPVKNGSLSPSRALNRVEKISIEQRRSVSTAGRTRLVNDFPPFAGVGNLVDATGDPSRFLSDLTETFAGLYLADDGRNIIMFIHAVTGPSAARLLLPYLDPKPVPDVLRAAWRAAASVYAAFAESEPPGSVVAPKETGRDLIDLAIRNGDAHAIKFTEVCLREHRVNPKPVHLAAARHVADAMKRR